MHDVLCEIVKKIRAIGPLLLRPKDFFNVSEGGYLEFYENSNCLDFDY